MEVPDSVFVFVEVRENVFDGVDVFVPVKEKVFVKD